MANLADLKLSLRLDDDTDDALLKGYLATAESYIKNAVAEDAPDDFWTRVDVNDLANTATLALAATYYNNRQVVTTTTVNPIDLTLSAIIGTLRGKYSRYQEEASADG